MIEAKVLSRCFTYNGAKLPDPDPRMTPEEVKTIYSHQYPELATAAITDRRPLENNCKLLRESYRDEGVALIVAGLRSANTN